jgi:hypothetical protein
MISRFKRWISQFKWRLGTTLGQWAENLRAPLHEELVPQRLLGVVFESGKVVYPKVTRREAAIGIKSVTIRNLTGADNIVAIIDHGIKNSGAAGLPVVPCGGDVIIFRAQRRARASA